jgi:hypothetical protein
LVREMVVLAQSEVYTHPDCSVALEGAVIDVECPSTVDGPSLVPVVIQAVQKPGEGEQRQLSGQWDGGANQRFTLTVSAVLPSKVQSLMLSVPLFSMAPPLFQLSFPHGVAEVFAAAFHREGEGRGCCRKGCCKKCYKCGQPQKQSVNTLT